MKMKDKKDNKIYLMNSAMMPFDCFYSRQEITEEEFTTLVTSATTIESSIGYESVSKHIQDVTGVSIPVNRDITTLKEDKGTILVCRLKFRPEAYMKGKIKAKKDDYEYLKVTFCKNIKIDKEMVDVINENATNIYEAFNISKEKGEEIDAKVISIATQNPLGDIRDFAVHLDALDLVYSKNEMRYAYYRTGVEMKKVGRLKELLEKIKNRSSNDR